MQRRMVRCVIVFLFLFLTLIHGADISVISEAFGADPPTVSISANPLSVAPNRSSTLSWSSTNATACSIDHGIGTVATSGTKRVTVPTTTTYTITATGPGGTATASVTVTIAPRPTLTFSADPYYIRSGQSSTLTWSTTGATLCFADWLATWVATSGTATVTPTKTRPYGIEAKGPGGQVQGSVTVTIVDPTVTISASPAAINIGEVSTLSWSSAKSNSCVIDQGIGGVPPTDSITVGHTQTTIYTITCTDPLGDTAAAYATVTVVPPPTVTISANPTSIITGQSTTLTWNTTNATDCSIDQGIGTVATTGTTTVSPTKTTTYTITATGPSGTAAAAVTVTFIPQPTVTISVNPVTINPGQSSTLTWSATDAVSCSIDQGIGAVSLSGTQSVSPSKTTTYTITATGSGGTTTAAATVTVNTASQIGITITSPADGETVTRSSVMVKGTVSNSFGNETGITINGIIAAVYNNEFAVNHVPLVEGANTITVTATDTTGTTTKSITVNATAPKNYIRVTSSPQSGTAPLEVALRINGSFSIANPVITPTGPGTVEQLTSSSSDVYRYKITTEGIYYFTVQVTGPNNNVYQDTVAVTALSASQLDALLRAKWTSMTDALQRKDTATALNLMHTSRRPEYQTMFNVLKDQLPAIVANYTELVLYEFEEDGAKYELKTMENNDRYSYRVYFIKGENGLWYIKVF